MATILQEAEIPLSVGNVSFRHSKESILISECEHVYIQGRYEVFVSVFGKNYSLGEYATQKSSSRRFKYAKNSLLDGNILEVCDQGRARIVSS